MLITKLRFPGKEIAVLSRPVGVQPSAKLLRLRVARGSPLFRDFRLLITISLLLAILTAGLWPFHAPANEITWTGEANGLHLGDYATILSSGTFKLPTSPESTSCSLEIWLQPGLLDDSNTFLAFYSPKNPRQFSLHQNHAEFALRTDSPDGGHVLRTSMISFPDFFREKRPLLITITSDTQSTAIYVDGLLLKTFAHFPLSSSAFVGELVVGNSALQNNSWSGELRGLAIYDRALTELEIVNHAREWKMPIPDLGAGNRCRALYLFNEHAGRVIHNAVKTGPNLFIPERYVVSHQQFLDRPDLAVLFQHPLDRDIVLNVGAFILFGLCVCCYLASGRHIKRAGLVTIAVACGLSVTIEAIQAYLPTRCSDMTDVITNTFGACVGVLMYRCYKAAGGLY